MDDEELFQSPLSGELNQANLRREMDIAISERLLAFESRFGRMEELLERVVKVEERLAAYLLQQKTDRDDVKELREKLDVISERVTAVGGSAKDATRFITNFERVGWLIAATAIANWDAFLGWLARITK